MQLFPSSLSQSPSRQNPLPPSQQPESRKRPHEDNALPPDWARRCRRLSSTPDLQRLFDDLSNHGPGVNSAVVQVNLCNPDTVCALVDLVPQSTVVVVAQNKDEQWVYATKIGGLDKRT